MVERDPSKVDVAGSSPVIRSFQGRSLASVEVVRLLWINRAPQSLTDLERRVAEDKRVRAPQRNMAQLGSAPALGAGGRGFKSLYSDAPQ